MGLINILTATAPLLRRSASSVLYSESLLMGSDDISTSLTTILGSDITTFSLLLGLVPSRLYTGATTDAVSTEAALFTVMQPGEGHRQYRMRVSWKDPEHVDPAAMALLNSENLNRVQITCDAQALANYCFDMYLTMFAHEDATKLMERFHRLSTGTYQDSLQRYTRAAMVALLRLVKTRVNVDWDLAMTMFCDRLDDDRTLKIGSNGLQELHMYLHLMGVWTSDAMRKTPEQLRR